MKDDWAYLQHIAESVGRIRKYTRSGREEFFEKWIIQDAVIRDLKIIGEAVKRLGEPARMSAPQIPWKQIAGMRDVLIHHYFGVKLDLVWEVVVRDLPPLEAAVENLLCNRNRD